MRSEILNTDVEKFSIVNSKKNLNTKIIQRLIFVMTITIFMLRIADNIILV